MFDEGDLANHPLPKAANALQEILKDVVQWELKDWFNPARRWDAEDDMRSGAGKAIATFNKIGKHETTTDRVATALPELDLPVNNAHRCCLTSDCTILLITQTLLSRHHRSR